MAAGVEQVAASARTVAAASEQTRAAAQHGAQAVRETQEFAKACPETATVMARSLRD